MTYRKLFSIIALGSMLFGFQGCHSDSDEPPAPPVLEDNTTVARRELCSRYGLPEEKIMDLKDLYAIAEGNIAVFSGINSERETAVIVCDTIANRVLYSNYSQIKFPEQVKFAFPYGESAVLSFNSFLPGSIAKNGDKFAATYNALYGDGGLTGRSAYAHYRFFYDGHNFKIIEVPQDIATVYLRDKIRPWYNGSYLFNFPRQNEELNANFVACYDASGNLLYEAPYPYYFNGNSYDPLNAKVVQPVSESVALGVNLNNGELFFFSMDIKESKLLWHQDNVDVVPGGSKDSDRMDITSYDYSNGILTMTVKVTSYDGTTASYKISISSEGEITSPN